MATSSSAPFTVQVRSATTTSPDKTYIGGLLVPAGIIGAPSLIDANLAKWTVVPNNAPDLPGQIGLKKDLTQVAWSVNFATIKAGVVYLQDQDPGGQPYWNQWTGTGWLSRVAAPF